MNFRISVDTGGTFTDVVVCDDSGRSAIGKALTVPESAFEGTFNAIGSAAGEWNLSAEALLAATQLLIYGTTRATNAIVTGSAAKTAMLVTAGFADVLLIREGGKSNPHDFSMDFPRPYVPRRHTFEIRERVGADGEVITPLCEESAAQRIDDLRKGRFEAVAVCLLWSIANATHELQIGRMLSAMMPGVPFTLSHQLLPVMREYRRASATAIDASLKPLMQAHLKNFEKDLRSAGYQGQILVSTLSGGCSSIDSLVQRPIYTIGSGPAMAPIAAMNFSASEGLGRDVIVCDAGGTTFDVCIVRDGRPTYSRENWIGPPYQGHLIGVSAVDVRSVGAGGGSIAWIDQAGLMRVGPASAGSNPGPACYGRGGTRPTVSDAAAVLGYLDPDYFLGGRMSLDVVAARSAMSGIARQAGGSVEQVAYQILGLAADLMVRAIEDLTINQGIDPRQSTLVAGGGAAGLNIMQIARELGCCRILLPRSAGALSATGMQFADIVCEETQSLPCLLSQMDPGKVNAVFDQLEAKLDDFSDRMRQGNLQTRFERFAEARYPGQIWELDTPIGTPRFLSRADTDALVRNFHELHERIFAVRDPGSPVEVISWKVRLVISLPKPDPETARAGLSGREHAVRKCFFGARNSVDTPVYKAQALGRGVRIEGPAIIEEPTTTLVIYPETSAVVSPAGHYLLEAV